MKKIPELIVNKNTNNIHAVKSSEKNPIKEGKFHLRDQTEKPIRGELLSQISPVNLWEICDTDDILDFKTEEDSQERGTKGSAKVECTNNIESWKIYFDFSD